MRGAIDFHPKQCIKSYLWKRRDQYEQEKEKQKKAEKRMVEKQTHDRESALAEGELSQTV